MESPDGIILENSSSRTADVSRWRLFLSTCDPKHGCTKSHPRITSLGMRSVSCTQKPDSRLLKPASADSVSEGNGSNMTLDTASNFNSCLCAPSSYSQSK